jgi:hypothetical protein
VIGWSRSWPRFWLGSSWSWVAGRAAGWSPRCLFTTCSVKGTVSRDGYFFKGLNILTRTFCECADDFQGLSEAFYCHIQLLIFLASLKLLTNFENATETLLRISFSVIGRCSQVPTTCHRCLSVLFYRITGASAHEQKVHIYHKSSKKLFIP